MAKLGGTLAALLAGVWLWFTIEVLAYDDWVNPAAVLYVAVVVGALLGLAALTRLALAGFGVRPLRPGVVAVLVLTVIVGAMIWAFFGLALGAS
ncbi:hypothetical protein OJ997_12530 [Solirubrobacter phytolaccae]|uniref:Uncharacterized protein n=1 Tax=Solirubrobacter phytolaccae TaxID=1404360 RepID=A0A9X3N7U7_9ACTN|nr:hypothetical protein [Solirubrobacter phytolaccae]MDA0181124.1 hypothetical protein [Solirubrobacter phytolaccae]